MDASLPRLGHLMYIRPMDLWQWLAAARAHLDDKAFWREASDELQRQGASVAMADEWTAGLRKLATGELPEVKG